MVKQIQHDNEESQNEINLQVFMNCIQQQKQVIEKSEKQSLMKNSQKHGSSKKRNQQQTTKEILMYKLGRPKKQQQISECDQTFTNYKYWFQDSQAREIVKILYEEGSIMYRIMGGKSAEEKKFQLENEKKDFDQYKMKRYNIYKDFKEKQKEILKALGMTKHFFFFKDQEGNSCDYDIHQLKNVVHPDFMVTLKEIYSSQDFYQDPKHFYLQNWAVIKLWSQKGLELNEHLCSPYQEGANIKQEYKNDLIKLKKCEKFYRKYNFVATEPIDLKVFQTFLDSLRNQKYEDYKLQIDRIIGKLRAIF